MDVHRRSAARLHLVFDLEQLATVGVGVDAQERQQLAAAVVDGVVDAADSFGD
jgi:hypothetical protein